MIGMKLISTQEEICENMSGVKLYFLILHMSVLLLHSAIQIREIESDYQYKQINS